MEKMRWDVLASYVLGLMVYTPVLAIFILNPLDGHLGMASFIATATLSYFFANGLEMGFDRYPVRSPNIVLYTTKRVLINYFLYTLLFFCLVVFAYLLAPRDEVRWDETLHIGLTLAISTFTVAKTSYLVPHFVWEYWLTRNN